jgi:hypothetical protein
MKLFISGNSVAAGNLFRQVMETIALAILCSGKDLKFIEKFMNNKYSPQKSIKDLFKYVGKPGLNKDSIKDLKKSIE